MRTLTLTIGLALSLATASAARGAVIVDQDSFPISESESMAFSSDDGFRRAQTFTVGVAGQLVGFEIQIQNEPTDWAVITGWTGRLLSTTEGAPLASSTILAFDLGGDNISGSLVRFDFDALGPLVAIGDVLALEVYVPGETRYYGYAARSDYVGGYDYSLNPDIGQTEFTLNANTADMAFRTFVDEMSGVPEPSTMLLVGLGLAGLGMARSGAGRRR